MTFDIDKWKSEAEEALAQLKQDREKHAALLASTNDEIDKIETALGIKVEMPTTKRPKIMLRGIIKAALIASGGLCEDGLVEAVQDEKPEATPSAIETAAKRLVRADDKYAYDEKLGQYSYIAPPEAAE